MSNSRRPVRHGALQEASQNGAHPCDEVKIWAKAAGGSARQNLGQRPQKDLRSGTALDFLLDQAFVLYCFSTKTFRSKLIKHENRFRANQNLCAWPNLNSEHIIGGWLAPTPEGPRALSWSTFPRRLPTPRRRCLACLLGASSRARQASSPRSGCRAPRRGPSPWRPCSPCRTAGTPTRCTGCLRS